MSARILVAALLLGVQPACASSPRPVSTEDVVLAVVLRDVIADAPQWATPLLCGPGRSDPSPALLALVRSHFTVPVAVCSDQMPDPGNPLVAIHRVTGARTYAVHWNSVQPCATREYEVHAGFTCGLNCGTEYVYRVVLRDGLWHVLEKCIVFVS